jgi:hypothetical protein
MCAFFVRFACFFACASCSSVQIYDEFLPEGYYFLESSMICGQKYDRQAYLVYIRRATAQQRKDVESAKQLARPKQPLSPLDRLRHPWARFDEGAFITQSTVHTMMNTGVAVMEPHTSRQTLVRVTDAEYSLCNEKNESKSRALVGYYPILDPQTQVLGEEVLILPDGSEFRCVIMRSTHVDVLRTDITDWYAQVSTAVLTCRMCDPRRCATLALSQKRDHTGSCAHLCWSFIHLVFVSPPACRSRRVR